MCSSRAGCRVQHLRTVYIYVTALSMIAHAALCRFLPQEGDETSSEHDPMEQPTYSDNTGAQLIGLYIACCNLVWCSSA